MLSELLIVLVSFRMLNSMQFTIPSHYVGGFAWLVLACSSICHEENARLALRIINLDSPATAVMRLLRLDWLPKKLVVTILRQWGGGVWWVDPALTSTTQHMMKLSRAS